MLWFYLYTTEMVYVTQEPFNSSQLYSNNIHDQYTSYFFFNQTYSLFSVNHNCLFEGVFYFITGYHLHKNSLIRPLMNLFILLSQDQKRPESSYENLARVFGFGGGILQKLCHHFKNHAITIIYHGNIILRTFQYYSLCKPEEGYKFNLFGTPEQLKDTIKIFGFSGIIPFVTLRHIKYCAQKGLVVVSMGNDGANYIGDKWRKIPLHKVKHLGKNVIFVGSQDKRANYFTPKQIQEWNINYVKVPFTYTIDHNTIEGTSIGQPYVSALLFRGMKHVPNLALDCYIDALMHAAKKDLYDFNQALFEMQNFLKSFHL